MAQVAFTPAPEKDAVVAKKAGITNLSGLGPPCRTVGRDSLRLASAQDRHGRCNGDGSDSASCRDVSSFVKDVGRVGLEGEPPPEEVGWVVDRPSEQLEPLRPKLRLETEAPC